jgi:hypothetical protein
MHLFTVMNELKLSNDCQMVALKPASKVIKKEAKAPNHDLRDMFRWKKGK